MLTICVWIQNFLVADAKATTGQSQSSRWHDKWPSLSPEDVGRWKALKAERGLNDICGMFVSVSRCFWLGFFSLHFIIVVLIWDTNMNYVLGWSVTFLNVFLRVCDANRPHFDLSHRVRGVDLLFSHKMTFKLQQGRCNFIVVQNLICRSCF